VGALESASAGTLDGPEESGPSTIAFSMEFSISTIEFFVSTAASAGIASATVVASAISILKSSTRVPPPDNPDAILREERARPSCSSTSLCTRSSLAAALRIAACVWRAKF
jgi:hypothetical protein